MADLLPVTCGQKDAAGTGGTLEAAAVAVAHGEPVYCCRVLRRTFRVLVSDPFRLHPLWFVVLLVAGALFIVGIVGGGVGDDKTPAQPAITTTDVPLHKECQNYAKYAGNTPESQTQLAELCARASGG